MAAPLEPRLPDPRLSGWADRITQRLSEWMRSVAVELNQKVEIRKAGTRVATRDALNFVEGSGVTLTIAEDVTNDEVDITIAASGVGTGKHTIWVPASTMIPRLTNGPAVGNVETATNKVMVRTLDFDSATAEYAQFTVQMPKSWNEGLLTANFVWSHATATDSTSASTGVTWTIMATAFSSGEALDATWSGSTTASKIGLEPQYAWITAETASFTVANTPSASDYVTFQVGRLPSDGSDTFGNDARLHGLSVFYTTDAATDD